MTGGRGRQTAQFNEYHCKQPPVGDSAPGVGAWTEGSGSVERDSRRDGRNQTQCWGVTTMSHVTSKPEQRVIFSRCITRTSHRRAAAFKHYEVSRTWRHVRRRCRSLVSRDQRGVEGRAHMSASVPFSLTTANPVLTDAARQTNPALLFTQIICYSHLISTALIIRSQHAV